jgi:hypothetical protein
LHVLGPWLAAWPEGSKPFGRLAARQAREELKQRLHALGVPFAHEYWLHDFRRGHTQDMLNSGSNLAQILRAGEWRTPAFLCYLDVQKLEKGAVVEAHEGESSSGSECDGPSA